MPDLLREIVARNKAGDCAAIPSVCSAHSDVLTSSLQLTAQLGRSVVIEATSNQVNQVNQVNQFGGYTGMNANAFVSFVNNLIETTGADPSQVLFGGDHLGPRVWKSENASAAMTKARVLVAEYIQAGIRKIHLDCSEGCAGVPAQVDDLTAAARAADLALACQDATQNPEDLIFVIGTEVPPPGGVRLGEDGHISATTPESATATLQAHQEAFAQRDISDLWALVSGLVVQPRVKFGPTEVYNLPLNRDAELRGALGQPSRICLEANSTDYQTPEACSQLANLGFGFQKVGPALTFAWLKALYALSYILYILRSYASGLPEVMQSAMNDNPKHWTTHYPDNDKWQWHFSYADRIRYYWQVQKVQAAVHKLFLKIDALNPPEHTFAKYLNPKHWPVRKFWDLRVRFP